MVDLEDLTKMNIKELENVITLIQGAIESKRRVNENPKSMLMNAFSAPLPLQELSDLTIKYMIGLEGIKSDHIWFCIPIASVSKETISDRPKYYLTVEGAEIELADSELSKPAFFIEKFFSRFSIALPQPKSNTWNLFRMYIKAIAVQRIDLSSIETEKVRIAEVIKNYIESAAVTTIPEEALRYNYILKAETGEILVHNESIKEIARHHIRQDITFKAIAEAVKDTMLESRSIRFQSGKHERFWVFKPEAYKTKTTTITPEPEQDSPNPNPDTTPTPIVQKTPISAQTNASPSPNPLRPLHTQGYCPACGKPKELYDTGAGWSCLDCWNERKGEEAEK